jgi:hypothetical protein
VRQLHADKVLLTHVLACLEAASWQLSHTLVVVSAGSLLQVSWWQVAPGLTAAEPGIVFCCPCRKALDALDCHTQNGWTRLLKGISDAKILQQAIIM